MFLSYLQQTEELPPSLRLWQIQLGLNSPISEAVEQWKDTMAHPEKVVAAWHRLSSS